jgi:hypothetical protein
MWRQIRRLETACGVSKLVHEYRAIYDVPPELARAFRERFYNMTMESV